MPPIRVRVRELRVRVRVRIHVDYTYSIYHQELVNYRLTLLDCLMPN